LAAIDPARTSDGNYSDHAARSQPRLVCLSARRHHDHNQPAIEIAAASMKKRANISFFRR
jgi:hypothetical protein